MTDPNHKITESDLESDIDTSSYYEESTDNSENEEENHPLANTWTVWFHKLQNTDWSINGYQQIYTFSTIENFWRFYNSIIVPDSESKVPFLMRGDFFIMKEGVNPMWEDPANINGCSISYLTKDEADHQVDNMDSDFEKWMELCIYLISNYEPSLNGISSSPKSNKFLFKLWKSDCEHLTVHDGFKVDLSTIKLKMHKECAEKEKNDKHHHNRGGYRKKRSYNNNRNNGRRNDNGRRR